MKLVDIIGESMDKLVDNKMINKIEKLLQEARTHVAVEVNNTLLRTYVALENRVETMLANAKKPSSRIIDDNVNINQLFGVL